LKKIFKKKYARIGILGGTFDPPHIGHLHISKIALKKLKLDNLVWIVTKQNPLKKKPFLNAKARVLLSENLTKNQKKIFVQYLDNKVKSQDTYNILNFLKNYNKYAKLFFLMGADNLINFHKWKKWKKIPQIAKIVVFARTNYSTKALGSIAMKKLKKKDCIYIKSKKINISSSLIRNF